VLGHRLVNRINAWKTFLANHPAFAATLQEWKALPPAQRRAAEHAWLAKHPVIRHDLRQLRADRRELRRDLRRLSRDLRP
jgi:hemophore-related protein